MDAPQYVNVDVPSGYVPYWMFYYTHHNDTDAPRYVHVDVRSVHLCYWMLYYTRQSDVDAPQYVSPAKKKKRSNITILKRGRKHYEMWGTNQ